MNGLVQNYCFSSVLITEILQSCTEPLISQKYLFCQDGLQIIVTYDTLFVQLCNIIAGTWEKECAFVKSKLKIMWLL